MMKLLRAGLRRYAHSHIFLRAVIVTVLIAAFCGYEARKYCFEDFYVMIFLVACSVLISWLVGREHDGGFRNKVITGHTKGCIYFSELIMGVVGSVILYTLFAMIFLGANSYIIGHVPIDVGVKLFLCGMIACACATAIVVTVSCMISRRAIVGLVSVLLIFALLFMSQTIVSLLRKPEYFEKYDYEYTYKTDEEGNTYLEMSVIEGSMHLVENPGYVKSPLRDILNVVCRLSPFTAIREAGDITYGWFGYDIQVSVNSDNMSHTIWENEADFSVTTEENTTLNIALIFSSIELIVIGGIGYFLFRKKELK